MQITIDNLEDSGLSEKIISIINYVSSMFIEDHSNMVIEVDFRQDLPFDGHATVDPSDEDDDNPLNFELLFKTSLLQDQDSFLLTLVHEMIHIKQFALNELRNYPNSIKYNGKFYRLRSGRIEQDKYRFYPWEIEAYDHEEIILEEWKKNFKKHIDRK